MNKLIIKTVKRIHLNSNYCYYYHYYYYYKFHCYCYNNNYYYAIGIPKLRRNYTSPSREKTDEENVDEPYPTPDRSDSAIRKHAGKSKLRGR